MASYLEDALLIISMLSILLAAIWSIFAMPEFLPLIKIKGVLPLKVIAPSLSTVTVGVDLSISVAVPPIWVILLAVFITKPSAVFSIIFFCAVTVTLFNSLASSIKFKSFN